jgi:NhaA family Na+:H+ antiporter
LTKLIPEEAWPGVVLLVAAALAIAIVNSPLAEAHAALLYAPFTVGTEGAAITMPVANWIKNALMAVFFFFVGLELKRELLEGELSTRSAAILPVAGAAGGMAVPALVYLAFAGDAFASGWAIPAATDIAFALGVLSLLGQRVPAPLKAFLLAVAVVDDLGAILIVAFVYTASIEPRWLALAGGVWVGLLVLNRLGVAKIGVYVLGALPLWVAMQNSGVNPTLAGVLVAALVPLHGPRGRSPLHDAEHALRPYVLFLVMPVFALANAGVSFAGGFVEPLTHPVALGIAVGLAVGKPIGIVVMTLLAARLIGAVAAGRLLEIVGVGLIAGIGFTMSLFIGALAFTDPALQVPVRVGVYAGSVVAALLGLALLAAVLPRRSALATTPESDPARPFIAEEAEYMDGDPRFRHRGRSTLC